MTTNRPLLTIAFFQLALLAACHLYMEEEGGQAKDSYVESPSPTEDDQEYGQDDACMGLGESCDAEPGSCCGPSFCDLELGSYGPGQCIAPLPTGGFCQSDSHCESGTCAANQCVDPSCKEQGEECSTGSCCEGLFCNFLLVSYLGPSCQPPLPDDSYCQEDAHCESGYCDPATLLCQATQACSPLGHSCSGLPCCGSAFLFVGAHSLPSRRLHGPASSRGVLLLR